MAEFEISTNREANNTYIIYFFNEIQNNGNLVYNNLKSAVITATNFLPGFGDCISRESEEDRSQNYEFNEGISNESK